MNPHNLNPNPDPNLHPDFQTNMLVFVAARRRSAICSPPCFPVLWKTGGENKFTLNLSVSLTTPVKPRRSQSQSVAVINLEMSALYCPKRELRQRRVKVSQTQSNWIKPMYFDQKAAKSYATSLP
jgi:hypothetical protein